MTVKTELPLWARSEVGGQIITPITAKLDQGFNYLEKPPFQTVNWLHNNAGKYLRALQGVYFDVVVGSAAQVINGVAQYVVTDLANAIVPAGSKVLLLEGTHTLTANITLSNVDVTVEGESPLAILAVVDKTFTLSGARTQGKLRVTKTTGGVVLSGTDSRIVAIATSFSLFTTSNGAYVQSSNAAYSVPPVGAILAVTGTFSLANNGGTYSETLLASLGPCWQICDGTVILDAESPEVGRFNPNLMDGRFMQGHSNSGVAGGSNTYNPSIEFANAGNYTPAGSTQGHALTIPEMPSHQHTVTTNALTIGTSNAYVGGVDAYSTDTAAYITIAAAGGGGSHDHGAIVGTAVARSDFFTNSTINIAPLYLSVKFYRRIK